MADAVTGDDFGSRTILLVEPDETIATSLLTVLSEGGFRLVVAASGEEAISTLANLRPDLVLLELALPDMPGLGLCQRIRTDRGVRVIAVSAAHSEAEALASFEAGADGYITKPYRLWELSARIRAALRRSTPVVQEVGKALIVGDVTLDAERHEVRVRSRVVELPLREFELLSVLLASPGKVWTREGLILRIWGETPASGTKTLDVHIRRLRSRIEDDPSAPTRILTVRGVGYKYAAELSRPGRTSNGAGGGNRRSSP